MIRAEYADGSQQFSGLPAADFIAQSTTELPGLPESAEFTPGSERESTIGPIALARAGWGGYLTTEAYISQMNGALTDLQKTQMRNLGFDGGIRFNPEVSDIMSPELQALQAGWAAKLAETVIASRGWDRVNALYIGSSTMTPDSIELARTILQQKGITIDTIRHHSLACQSWTTSLVHALTRPELQEDNVVVVGLDTLSPMTDPNDPIIFALFGNGGGAIAFKPGKEVQYLLGKTQFEHDAKGITTCTPIRELPPRNEWIPYPENFVLKGDETPDYLAVTDGGVFMTIPPSRNGKIGMNARGTFAYFVIDSGSFELIREQVAQYTATGFEGAFGPLGIPFGHQPSREVLEGINNYAVKQYERKKLFGSPQHFTWVMDKTGFNNVSAGTGLIAMEEISHAGQLLPDSVHLMLGLGIGNSIGAHVVRFV